MSDPVLHIKDSYFFEIPKFMWRYHFADYSEVPHSMEFLVEEAQHHHLTIDQFNQELAGKILIPQPFAKLKDLHQVESGFAISKFMVLELLVAAAVAFVFIRLANRMSKQNAPQGRLWNMFEAMLVFVRNEVVRPSIGDHHDHEHSHGDGDTGHFIENVEDTIIGGKAGEHLHHHSDGRGHGPALTASAAHPADKFLPLFWTMFFFILFANLFGLLPWLGSPTGSFGVTFALACVTFATTVIAGMFKFGPLGFFFNQVPSMDLPWYMSPLKLVIFAIELLGLCIKHLILAVRLLANMVAGHLVLLGILGLIATSAASSAGLWSTVTVISVVSSTLFSLLELMVAFLQAYIFTFLSALFIGAAVHKH